jgi:hypothetical protein
VYNDKHFSKIIIRHWKKDIFKKWNFLIIIFFSQIAQTTRFTKKSNYRSCRVAGIWILQHRGMLWWLPGPTQGLNFQRPMLLFPLFCVFSKKCNFLIIIFFSQIAQATTLEKFNVTCFPRGWHYKNISFCSIASHK